MSKEDLLIALLKSNQSHTEFRKSKDNNTEIGETKKIFNELRNNFLKEEIKKIRRKFYFKESIDEYLKELEQKDSLTKQEKQEKKRYTKKLQKAEEFLKKLKEDLNKLKRHQYNIIEDIDYKGIKEIENLFNKINEEDYYEPIKISGDFNDNYMEYESRGDKDKKLLLEDYLNIIRPYLRDLIDNHKTHSERKIQLIMRISFISSLDAYIFREMHTKSDNIEIMNGTETNDIIKELFESFLRRYQDSLKTKMKGSEFIFESIDLLYYSLHKISLNRGGSYIDSPDWIKNKKATINPKNKDNECFKYAITAALNHNKIKNHPEKISKLKPFIENYNWEDIKFPSHLKDWKSFEQNNKTIALNILFVPSNTKNIRPIYISKYNYKHDNQVNLLMITDSDKHNDGVKNWHYLAVKSIPKLLRGITSNHHGDFYCLNCFHSYTTINNIKKHQKICKDHDFCHVKMPNENNKILKYNPGKKSLKAPAILFADLESLLQKIDTRQNNPENLIQKEKLSIDLLVTLYLQAVYSINQKPNVIIIEENIVWKDFVKT